MNIYISIGVAILLFICAFLGFRQGLRLGMQSAKGIVPQKLTAPAKFPTVDIKPPEMPSAFMQGYANMMNFTGEPPKEEK